MRWSLLSVVSLLAPLLRANPISNVQAGAKASATPTTTPGLPRLIVYFQTTHDQAGNPISMLPLINEKGIALTHLIVCSLHINRDAEIHLNDYPPGDPHFYTLWNETTHMKKAGVKVMGMIGGAAPGSFDSSTLDGDAVTFEEYYTQVRDVINTFGLQGMDLDVEQPMSQSGISRLISRLRKDFGRGFIITLAPVASALRNGGNLSGFNYKSLESSNGRDISFYNGQFYSGFGTMARTDDYVKIVSNGFTVSKVVAGQLTSSDNGYGYVPYSQLNATIISLRDKYGQIGGVMGWEYFNSQPGGTSEPWEWAQVVTEILRPNSIPDLRITMGDADHLTAVYDRTVGDASPNARPGSRAIDYYAMVNA
ncbi:coagulation factor 5 8 type domain [Cordyceps militaris]|uniref:Coagulation factor 5 8 type domain n=1 Tax=Cordyceps militaris TaxID=73501 RepID=A0A2H4SVR4_CORMI|nr:coagulation factor 5 8 type domain [Cordyceps militaris]